VKLYCASLQQQTGGETSGLFFHPDLEKMRFGIHHSHRVVSAAQRRTFFRATSFLFASPQNGGRLSGATTTPVKNFNVLPLPRYFRALTESEQSDIDRLASAYGEGYFGHIRFRKGWAEPQFKREEVDGAFTEAAQIVQRIRLALDERNKASGGATVLRQLDGEAQVYLHKPEAATDFRQKIGSAATASSSGVESSGSGSSPSASTAVEIAHERFIRALVHATLRDAKGYVEGLTKRDVEIFIDAVTRHRFDPSTHFAHVLQQIAQLHEEVEAARAAKNAARAASGAGAAGAYVEEGSEAEKAWRAVIGKMYEATTLMQEVLRVEANNGKKKE
jgi:hypothetical protein